MTERMLIDADDSVVDDLRGLTAEGVQIALDDFGTGYASLSYLQRFPVSTLKIDRSFVKGMGVTATDTAIVASVVALAQALDLDVDRRGRRNRRPSSTNCVANIARRLRASFSLRHLMLRPLSRVGVADRNQPVT